MRLLAVPPSEKPTLTKYSLSVLSIIKYNICLTSWHYYTTFTGNVKCQFAQKICLKNCWSYTFCRNTGQRERKGSAKKCPPPVDTDGGCGDVTPHHRFGTYPREHSAYRTQSAQGRGQLRSSVEQSAQGTTYCRTLLPFGRSRCRGCQS